MGTAGSTEQQLTFFLLHAESKGREEFSRLVESRNFEREVIDRVYAGCSYAYS
jgi:hypothetical protein